MFGLFSRNRSHIRHPFLLEDHQLLAFDNPAAGHIFSDQKLVDAAYNPKIGPNTVGCANISRGLRQFARKFHKDIRNKMLSGIENR